MTSHIGFALSLRKLFAEVAVMFCWRYWIFMGYTCFPGGAIVTLLYGMIEASVKTGHPPGDAKHNHLHPAWPQATVWWALHGAPMVTLFWRRVHAGLEWGSTGQLSANPSLHHNKNRSTIIF